MFLLNIMSHPNLTPQQIADITTHINTYRSKHHAKSIEHNVTITAFTQSYASQLAQSSKFEHSGNRAYGENLAMFRGMADNIVVLVKRAIDSWYSEVKAYDYAKATFVSGTGHFTQLVWNTSTQYGIGYSYNIATKTAVVSMNFNPPGNMMGRFKENVSTP